MDLLIWVLVVDLVVFGSLTGWLATTKNRAGFVWFLLGALLGPLALIAVGLAPALAPEVSRFDAGGYIAPTKQCPDCGEDVRAEAAICRFCRHRFPPDERAPTVDLGRELDQWESLGLWIVGSAFEEHLAKGATVEVGIGATRLIVLSETREPILTLNIGRAFLDRAGDRVMNLLDGNRLLATLRWYSGPNAPEAQRQLARAKGDLRERLR